jgi:2-hydroxychromene-2-carboxylate isomerase
MTLVADLFWSFRSPYSYLATARYRRIAAEYDVEINVRPVYPLAIRQPNFFDKINLQWVSYLLRDCQRIAEYQDLPFAFPKPDPVVMDMVTREISEDQPHIFWLTRLGIAASRNGKGLAFIDEMSSMIWGGVENWNSEKNLAEATKRAGLDLASLRRSIEGNEKALDAEIVNNQAALEKSGHWGVPTLVFENEPFFGQDRIDLALWRMQQKGLEAR